MTPKSLFIVLTSVLGSRPELSNTIAVSHVWLCSTGIVASSNRDGRKDKNTPYFKDLEKSEWKNISVIFIYIDCIL